ncbi:MAG TPA: nickel pincer cofactor biosynthesis protein LarB [Terriglobales bacterium]|nr:nickel pincer cofactor biosynthesis protein LarB [Terriglobales bacterium]
MTEGELRELMEEVAAGAVTPHQAAAAWTARARRQPFEDLGFARVDHHRRLRQGTPEVILAQGKTAGQVAAIAAAVARESANLLITRADAAAAAAVETVLPQAEYLPGARVITLRREPAVEGRGVVLVVAAGTSDLPVAEEAAITAEMFGGPVERLYDCGVAGLHRLLAEIEKLQRAQVLIVAAGMEGALPSVVGGLVAAPVIAVPTSIGYGASFGGLAALLGMLNSCSSNVVTVNIDNGFGAGFVAASINRH